MERASSEQASKEIKRVRKNIIDQERKRRKISEIKKIIQ